MTYSNFLIITVLSILSGILIGFNRRCKGAGVRDFALIITGVSLITFSLSEVLSIDSSAYEGLSNLIVAMGFIAGGIMFHQQHRVMGITTGLAIFAASVIGIMYGLQQYIYGAIFSISVIIILMLHKVHKTCE